MNETPNVRLNPANLLLILWICLLLQVKQRKPHTKQVYILVGEGPVFYEWACKQQQQQATRKTQKLASSRPQTKIVDPTYVG